MAIRTLFFWENNQEHINMKCIQITKIKDFEKKEIDLQAPGNEEVLIKVHVTGVCRTDLKIIQHGHRDLILPRIPGEEVVGTIHEKGKNVRYLNVGDRVYVYPGQWCGKCPLCLAGAENLCNHMKIMGFHRDGGFAEYVTVPSKTVIKIPDSLSMEEAVFAEPLSCCLNALELGGIAKDKTIGIWGAGPAGTLLSRASSALGAFPISIEPDEKRRSFVNGFSTCPESHYFDICVVAVGNHQAYHEAIQHLNPRGKLVIFSGLLKPHDVISVNFNKIHYLEQSIVGAYGCCYRHGEAALNYLSQNKIAVNDLITHQLPLYDLEHALNLVENRKCMKVHLYP
jgi:L-iditol 2-dehydrogenase